MALICCGSSDPRTRTTIEADGSGVSRANSGRSGSTRWTLAAWMRSMARMVRASSPSSARRWVMFCTQLVGYALALQILDDPGRVLHAQIREQRGHLRRRNPHDNEREEADQPGAH